MKKEIILSIITVTKNCRETIARTLESIKAVKSDKIEYIVIDGASSDGTLNVIENWKELVDKFISEPDAGIYEAMNKGVSLARGKYICFVNGDDEIVPNDFQSLLKKLNNETTAIVCASAIVVSVTGENKRLDPKIIDLPYYNSVPHISSFVPRLQLIERPFREDLRIASDYDFFLNSLILGLEFKIINIISGKHYRGGISSDTKLSSIEIKIIQKNRLKNLYLFYRIKHIANKIHRKLFN